ncbi:hypothetical protein H0H81_003778 [Sphagnurus paluster]|uniref:Uncharacterized protein n=1 Tax=Sphagnurus paluster TaxID=117069 RepID=A0A9P7GSU6_9AGAR|nr:hypothetical protein H0H81_003778 [Sphagnurus paluster]
MASETSTVSISAILPSRTSPSTFANPTVFPNSHVVQPRVNEILGRYYVGSVDSFQPTFYALDDGSLITPPFVDDMTNANLSLLVMGMLTMLFLRNTVVSGDYLRRVNIKKKGLFYVLFISQALAPVSLLLFVASWFNRNLNCTFVVTMSCVITAVSLALLITGILGVKAYRCLNDSRIVLIVLSIFQVGSAAVIAMDAVSTRAERRPSGSCIRVSDLLSTRVFVWIQLVESFFICCCFMYACWKSRGSAAARGRISIQLSMNEQPIEVPEDLTEKQPSLRGWWDYAPDLAPSPKSQVTSRQSPTTMRSKLDAQPTSDTRRMAIAQTSPHLSAIRNQTFAIARGTSPTPSSGSRLSKLASNIQLFQKVIKDEIQLGSVVSILAIHSFGRVVRRHEREALLQRPFMSNMVVRAGNSIYERKPRASHISTLSLSRYRREDPFADTRRLQESRGSWASINNYPVLRDPFDDRSREGYTISNPFEESQPSEDNTLRRSLNRRSSLVGGSFPGLILASDSGSIISRDEKRKENMSGMEEDDEIISVLPIHYSTGHFPDIQLHQFPLLTRPLQAPPSAVLSGKRITARMKPEVRRLEVHVPADTRPEVWNVERTKELGAARVDDDREKNQEIKGKVREGEEPRLSEIRMQSEEILQKGTYMLGVVRDGQLHLHPITQTHQFRPTLTYLDMLSRKNKRGRGGDDSDSDDGPPPDPDEVVMAPVAKKEKKPTGESREVQVTARKAEDKGGQIQGGLSVVRREMLQAIRAEEDEKWEDLEFYDVTSVESGESFEGVFSQSDDVLECKTDITTFLKDIQGL